VQIAAPPGCEPAARHFFGDLLGLKEIEKPEQLRARGGAWFSLGDGRQLHIGIEELFAPTRKAHPAFRLSPAELDDLAERLESAGERVEWDDSLPGVRRFYTVDPWGNRLELLAR
jgi:catechol 2,3-dioxygenase-like lactoylglutathione lyase family enzyme